MTSDNFQQFCREHKWTQILDIPSLTNLEKRFTRAQDFIPNSVTAYGENGVAYYQVDSATRPGEHYIVTIINGCTCPDTDHHAPFRWCKHRIAAWLYHRWQHKNDEQNREADLAWERGNNQWP